VIGEKAQSVLLKASLGLAVFLSLIGVNAAVAFVRPCGLLPQSLCEEPRLTTPAPSKKV